MVGILEQFRDGIRPMLLTPAWEGTADPVDRVFALLDGYRQLLMESDYRLGCPIGNIALEIAEPDPVVRERLKQNFEAWTDAVAGCLEEAGDRLPREVDRRALARFALTTMEGGVMLARTYRDIGPFDVAVAGFRDHLNQLMRQEG